MTNNKAHQGAGAEVRRRIAKHLDVKATRLNLDDQLVSIYEQKPMATTARMAFRKRESCGSVSSNEEYNLGLHIFALFLIMTCGTLACSFPVLVKAFPKLAVSRHALFISRHFGTGVLIALAFAHLLPTAFENLWNECLRYVWTEGYDAMPGVIAMASALAVMLVEMGFTMHGLRHSHALEDVESEGKAVGSDVAQARMLQESEPWSDTGNCSAKSKWHAGPSSTPIEDHAESAAEPRESSHIREDQMQYGSISRSSSEDKISKQQEQRMVLQCILLEAGILFHSVFIGLSISLSTGTTFIALIIAISFHQIFEGLALGGRIAAIPSLRISSARPWLMSLAYGLTCPLGQAIGLGMRRTYDPEGMTALLVVGIANAISAGMILYAGLVQLLGEDLVSEESYRKLSVRSRFEATTALILGCALMALIAIWA